MRGVKTPYEYNHKLINGEEYKLCSDCNKWFLMNSEYFYKNKSSPDGLNPYCKDCTKKRSSKWQQIDNKERYLENKFNYNKERRKTKEVQITERKHSKEQRENGYYKKWQLGNKDKIQDYNQNKLMHRTHEITEEEWGKCKDYFDNSCGYCGISEEQSIKEYGQQLHKEHVVHDGSNGIDNCIPACKKCNSQKWKFSIDNWYTEDNEKFSEKRLNKIIKWLNEDYIVK